MRIIPILLGLAASVFLTVRPVQTRRFEIGPLSAPVAVLAILFAVGVVSPLTILRGIVGDGVSRPWQILVVFFSVAYVSTSTDVTGVFDYIAYRVVLQAKGDGRKLFLLVYLSSSILTIFTSNDIVILTLTPIIFYIGSHARINVVPLLFAEFFGANTLSSLLVIGNPTNLIVAAALDIGFREFTRVTILPTAAAFVMNGALLFLVFRRDFTGAFSLRPESMFRVRNWADAGVSVALLLTMIGALVTSDLIGLPVWAITALAAAAFTVEDLIFTLYYERRAARNGMRPVPGRWFSPRRFLPEPTYADTHPHLPPESELRRIPDTHNSVYLAHMRVPWRILPFVAVCFVLVEALDELSLTGALGSFLIGGRSPTAGLALTGAAGLLLGNLINNQPMTMLLSRALSEAAGPSTETLAASGYALVIASNLAANLTVLGALAGIMWRRILETKGIIIHYAYFLKVGLKITPLAAAVSLGVLALVTAWG